MKQSGHQTHRTLNCSRKSGGTNGFIIATNKQSNKISSKSKQNHILGSIYFTASMTSKRRPTDNMKQRAHCLHSVEVIPWKKNKSVLC